MQIIYSRETLDQVIAAGIESLLQRHWREVELANFQDIPLEPDWEAYARAERGDCLRIFTARIAEELVGYTAYFVNISAHCRSSLQASQDVFFLVPERRGAYVGSELIAYAERALAAEGVQVIYQHVKAAHPMDGLLKRQGYELMDTVWAKRLDWS